MHAEKERAKPPKSNKMFRRGAVMLAQQECRAQKEEVSLEDKMEDLKKYAAGHRHFSFRGLLTAQSSKVEVIVTFLAILELMKMGTIRISQEHIFDDIQIDSKVAA